MAGMIVLDACVLIAHLSTTMRITASDALLSAWPDSPK